MYLNVNMLESQARSCNAVANRFRNQVASMASNACYQLEVCSPTASAVRRQEEPFSEITAVGAHEVQAPQW